MCRVASEAGFVPRALVRPGSSTKALEALGAELAWGDIRDEGAVDAAVAGCAHVVHTAALVPGPTPATREDFEAINVTGTRHVVAAAERHGAESLVHFSTSIHEVDGSLQSPERRVEPYAATKSAAFEIVQGAAARGLRAMTVCPGAVIGPAPTLGRAVEPPGFNARFILAARGEIPTFPAFFVEPVLAEEVATACLAMIRRGTAGAVYFTFSDHIDTVTLLNLACEAAGVSHRVQALTEEELASDETGKRWGSAVARFALEALVAMRAGHVAKPENGSIATRASLAYEPRSPEEAVRATMVWMKENTLL